MKSPQLKSLAWNLLLEWADGVIVPIQIYVNADMLGVNKLTDADVTHILESRVRVFTEAVTEGGLEVLREQGIDCGGEQPFHLLINSMRDLFNGRYVRVNDATGESELNRRQMAAFLRNYVSLIQATIRPALPPEIWRQIEALKGPQQAQPPMID